MENIFINIPALTISDIFNSLEPNTTALGGVATGNMNAQEAARVVPARSKKGFICIIFAIGIITGRSIAVVAIFEVISVKKLTPVIIKRIINSELEKVTKDN